MAETAPAVKHLLCLVAIGLVYGCSVSGTLVLHNASGEDIEVIVVRASGPVEMNMRIIQIAAGATTEIAIDNLSMRPEFSIRTRTKQLCYALPKIDPSWIKPGLFGGAVLAELDERHLISLFLPHSNRSGFFMNPKPTQPSGFPLFSPGCADSTSH